MKQIELLLLETIENLGIVGDVVKVRPGYARNYLLPHGLAEAPTEEKIKELSARRAEVEAELKQVRGEQEALIAKLADFELTLERSANEQGALFGGVSQHDIAQALQAEGFAVEDRHIRIGEKIAPASDIVAARLRPDAQRIGAGMNGACAIPADREHLPVAPAISFFTYTYFLLREGSPS